MVNKKSALFLAMALFTAQVRADNTAVAGILGTSVLLVGGIGYALYISCRPTSSSGYTNVTDFQTAMQKYANQEVATKYADSYNALEQASGMSTPTSQQYQDDYPNDWAQACKDFISNNVSGVSGISSNDFNNFVDNWVSSSGDSYADALTSISKAVSTGSDSDSIGKWSVPDGYSNTLDYMIKNNINSPSAVESLNAYMVEAKAGYFPAKYTPGDVPPPNVPDVPDVPINTPGVLPSTGTGQSTSYVEAYNKVLQDYNTLAKSLNIADYNNMLEAQYSTFKSQIATAQEDINEAIASGETDVSALKSQLESFQAQADATAEAYKAANDGQVIPEE